MSNSTKALSEAITQVTDRIAASELDHVTRQYLLAAVSTLQERAIDVAREVEQLRLQLQSACEIADRNRADLRDRFAMAIAGGIASTMTEDNAGKMTPFLHLGRVADRIAGAYEIADSVLARRGGNAE